MITKGLLLQPSRDPPRTTVEETVLDLAQLSRTFDDACGWITKACAKRLTTEEKLRIALELRTKMRWRIELADVLTAAGDGIHSVLEYRYVRDVERWRDSQRDNQASARGVETCRYTWRDVYAHACETALLQAQILRRRGWRGTPRPCSVRCPVGREWTLAAERQRGA